MGVARMDYQLPVSMMPIPRPSAIPGTAWPNCRLGFRRLPGSRNQLRMTPAALRVGSACPVKQKTNANSRGSG